MLITGSKLKYPPWFEIMFFKRRGRREGMDAFFEFEKGKVSIIIWDLVVFNSNAYFS